MYKLINRNVVDVLDRISTRDLKTYSELVDELNTTDVSKDEKYRKKYHGFWKMRFPSHRYRETYFSYLQEHKKRNGVTPKAVCQALKNASLDENRKHVIQFSFATKLAHMLDQKVPIYDDRVSAFFFIQNPKTDTDFDNRLDLYSKSYEFLKREYERVIVNGLLETSIRAFREQFHEILSTNPLRNTTTSCYLQMKS